MKGKNTLEVVVLDPADSDGAADCGIEGPLKKAESDLLLIGAHKAYNVVTSVTLLAWAQNLDAIKRSKAYRRLGIDWETFCKEHTPFCREKVEQLIADFREFGSLWFRLRELVKIRRELFRHVQPAEVEDGKVKIGDEIIPLAKAHAPEIQAAFQVQEKKLESLQSEVADAKKAAKKAQEKAKDLAKRNEELAATIREMKDTSGHFKHATEHQKKLLEAQAYGVRMIQTIHGVANAPDLSDAERVLVRGLGEYMTKLIMLVTCDDPVERTIAQKLGGTDLIDEYNREHGITEKIVDLSSRRPQ